MDFAVRCPLHFHQRGTATEGQPGPPAPQAGGGPSSNNAQSSKQANLLLRGVGLADPATTGGLHQKVFDNPPLAAQWPLRKALICSNDTHNSLSMQYKRPKDNLTPDERKALKELKSLSDSVIIKPADKGSAVVLMDKSDYLKEGLRQLSDLHFYRPVQEDLSAVLMLSIRDIVLNMREHKEISKKVKDFLLDFPMHTSRLYLLPKIHKGKFPPPGRPIISGNGCLTERISQFVDFFLKEVAPKGTSFLKDTNHFLQSLHAIDKTPPGTLLVPLDVTSLYTNIPNIPKQPALDAFILHLNSAHSSIKFTAEISTCRAYFLDTTVHRNED